MKSGSFLKWSALGAVVVATLAVVALIVAAPAQASVLPSTTVNSTRVVRLRFGEGSVDFQSHLAEALSISLEELEAAQQAAFETKIDEAVEAGTLTQEQADQILESDRRLMPDPGHFGVSLVRGWMGIGTPYNDLLAAELGITSAELEIAIQAAHNAVIEQLLEEGALTEEQAALVKAANALRSYLDGKSMTAEALGISVEALDQAREAGASIPELIEASGLDSETFQEKLAAVREAAVALAVENGVITEEQADQLDGRIRFGPGYGSGRGSGPRSRQHPGCGDGFRSGRFFAPPEDSSTPNTVDA
jgi:hypothetical protein